MKKIHFIVLSMTACLGFLYLSGCHNAPTYPLCKNDTHCKTGANGESLNGVCVNGTCQQCAMNSDCGENEDCVENSCVANNLPKKGAQSSEFDEDTCSVNGKTVHFDFDQYDISNEDQANLNRVAKCLVEKSVKVVLEGNTDERGSSEYNLALGQKRADAVAKYLANNGVTKNRMKSVSYGKERPVDSNSNEDAWSKNRRTEIRTQQ